MAARSRAYVIIQWTALTSQFLSLSFLLHSLLGDHRSQMALQTPPEGSRNALKSNKDALALNCAKNLTENDTLASYLRDPVGPSATFVILFFFWWLNSLVLCVQFCHSNQEFWWMTWMNFSSAFVWLIGGGNTLWSYLDRLSADKAQGHRICLVNLASDQDEELWACKNLLCQAAVSKLAHFGFSMLAAWLHVLAFIGTVGRDAGNVHESPSSISGPLDSESEINPEGTKLERKSEAEATEILSLSEIFPQNEQVIGRERIVRFAGLFGHLQTNEAI